MRAALVAGIVQLLVISNVLAQSEFGDDLVLPRSLHQSELTDPKIILVISRDAIHVNLDYVLDLEDGSVPVHQRVSETSPIVPVLQEAIEEAVYFVERWAVSRIEQPGRSCLIALDRHTTYETLTYAMMTASVAGVREFSFLASATDWSSLWTTGTEGAWEPTVLPIHSPTTEQSVFPEENSGTEPMEPPSLLVAIAEDGFVLTDLDGGNAWEESQFGRPIVGCPQFGETESELLPTICIPESNLEHSELVDRLDYRGLYNRLVQIRQWPPWAELYNADNHIIHVLADQEVEVDVVIHVMNVAHRYLTDDFYVDDASFESAEPRFEEGSVMLFPTAVFLLPRSSSD